MSSNNYIPNRDRYDLVKLQLRQAALWPQLKEPTLAVMLQTASTPKQWAFLVDLCEAIARYYESEGDYKEAANMRMIRIAAEQRKLPGDIWMRRLIDSAKEDVATDGEEKDEQ